MASFAQDCAFTNVRTLNAADFSAIISEPDSAKPWFIDFFAPVSNFAENFLMNEVFRENSHYKKFPDMISHSVKKIFYF